MSVNTIDVPVRLGTLINGRATVATVDIDLAFDQTFENMREWTIEKMQHDWIVLLPDIHAGIEKTVWMFTDKEDAFRFKLTWSTE